MLFASGPENITWFRHWDWDWNATFFVMSNFFTWLVTYSYYCKQNKPKIRFRSFGLDQDCYGKSFKITLINNGSASSPCGQLKWGLMGFSPSDSSDITPKNTKDYKFLIEPIEPIDTILLIKFAESVKIDPVLKFTAPTGYQQTIAADVCIKSFKEHLESLLSSKQLYAGSSPARSV